MITAKLQYRSYVPSGWIAIEFTDLEIYGSDALSHAWSEEESKTHHKIYDPLDSAEREYKSQQGKYDAWLKESFWNRFRRYKDQKLLDELQAKWRDLEDGIVENHAWEDRRAAGRFLEKHGFVLTNSSESGGECSVTTEVYKQELPNTPL